MTEVEEHIFNGDFRMIVCTNRVVKMKQNVPFCKDCSILCTEDRVVVGRVA